jgi:hypothetical protein
LGRRSPRIVRSIATIRWAIDALVAPTYRIGCDGSQNAASLATSAFDVGRDPSSRSPSTRSIHLPAFVSSIGAVGRGAGSSTTNTPRPDAGTGRPHTTGPSAMSPTARRREGASTPVFTQRW